MGQTAQGSRQRSKTPGETYLSTNFFLAKSGDPLQSQITPHRSSERTP